MSAVGERPDTHQILLLGEDSKTSAPTATLSRGFLRAGISSRFSNLTERDGLLSWRRSLKDVRGIIFVAYGRIDSYLMGQLAYAVSIGVPLTRWWVGTDVLNVTTDTATADSARSVGRIICANIAVAPHLVSELAIARIRALYIPSVIDSEASSLEMGPLSPVPKPILVYLPTDRQEFYGRHVLEAAVVRNPTLRFVIVGDESHSLAGHANVDSLGWVSDMRPIYDRCGCILRLTEHDGMPRMLIESLLRGMYAIYSWPLAGCWLARNLDEVQTGLTRYANTAGPNCDGRAAMLETVNGRPERQIADIATRSAPVFRVRVRALRISASQKLTAKLGGMLRERA